MKQLAEAGYWPKEDEGKTMEVGGASPKKEKKKRFATINANDLEVPMHIKGLESGDKLLMTAIVNVDQITSVDKDKSYNGESKRFEFSIEQCSFERTLGKDPSEMTDEELEEAAGGKKNK